jgi:hypothetical protein
MPDVDVLLSRIARANGFAAAMIDTAMRKRFELMVGEFQRELDAIEERPVSQKDSDKTEAGDRVALRWRTAASPCIRLGSVLNHEEPLSHPRPVNHNRHGTLLLLAD